MRGILVFVFCRGVERPETPILPDSRGAEAAQGQKAETSGDKSERVARFLTEMLESHAI